MTARRGEQLLLSFAISHSAYADAVSLVSVRGAPLPVDSSDEDSSEDSESDTDAAPSPVQRILRHGRKVKQLNYRE